MPADIYDQHDAAFSRVSAYVVAKDGKRVATIAFKLPADSVGRLYAYVHWLGEPMVRGYAGGYGYDKRSAAAAVAARRLPAPNVAARMRDSVGEETLRIAAEYDLSCAFRNALLKDGGPTWDRELERAGFTVWQAV